MDQLIGFVGQGWVGKSYADDFEKRGFKIVRYGLEDQYKNNKDKIKNCDIVFIAVPTPTLPGKGFDDSILRDVIKIIGKKKTAVIKSTILPGTTQSIQEENPDIFVLHSPEFLVQATAVFDAANPKRNIIGIPTETEEYKKKAEEVMGILPRAPYEIICGAKEAEIIKYGGNSFLYFKVIYMNLIYDLVKNLDCDWEIVRKSIAADPRIGESHTEAIHNGGRGVGGGCFVKDFAALSDMYKMIDDKYGLRVLEAIKEKNIDLIKQCGKDIDIIKSVYGNVL